jgi:hypothetical protein
MRMKWLTATAMCLQLGLSCRNITFLALSWPSLSFRVRLSPCILFLIFEPSRP